MASSKKNKNTTPQDQALAAKRVAFVKSKPELSPVEARTRFFVQTRAAELQAKGVEVTKQRRQELRQKFASGGVQRTGFYTPADIARAAASNTGTGGSTDTTSGTSGSRPQDLADYKNTTYSYLDKENMARRPVAPKKPDFDKYSMNPAEFLDSPFAKGVTAGAKFVGNTIKDAGESLAASSINPVLNIPQRFTATVKDIKEEGIKRVFWSKGGKNYEAAKNNPNFREAGIVESALNIAPLDVVGGLVVRGTSKVLGKTVTQVVRGTDNYAANALANLGKGGKAGTVDLITGAYTAPIKTAAKNVAKNAAAGKSTSQVVRGIDDYVKTALKANKTAAKSGTVDLATGAYQGVVKNVAKNTAKKAATKPAAKKAATKTYTRMRDIAFDVANGTPAEKTAAGKIAAKLESAPKATPKATPAKSVAPKATPAKAAKKEVDRFANAWDDSPIDMSKVDFGAAEMRSTSNYSTARRANKVTDAASAPKATPAKTTKPKARAKAGFKAKVNEVKSTPAPVSTKSSFKTQAEYNDWLKGGGKETLRNMTQGQRNVFLKANDKFVQGAAAKAQQAAAEQAKSTARALKTEKLYKGARPELQAKFNKALLNRQQRQLLAKIAPKK